MLFSRLMLFMVCKFYNCWVYTNIAESQRIPFSSVDAPFFSPFVILFFHISILLMLFCNKWYHNKLNEQIWQVSWIIPISECNAWYLELPWKQRKTCYQNKDFFHNFTLPFWIYVTYQKIMQLFKLANFWLHVAMQAPNI